MTKEEKPYNPKTVKDERFIDAWAAIKKRYKLKSNRSFLIANGFPHDLVSKIFNGHQSVQDNFLYVLEEKFNLDLGYIHGTTKNVFKKDTTRVEEAIEGYNLIEDNLTTKDKLIRVYEDTIEDLREQLKSALEKINRLENNLGIK